MARNENGKGFSLKDELFNETKVRMLGGQFAASYAAFDAEKFVATVMETMLDLELKERIGCITNALALQLPEDFEVAASVMVEALPPALDPSKRDNDFGDFIYAPLGEYVARNGCSQKHLHVALATLREITMRFSMEDAIRTFLNEYPQETLSVLKQWAVDDSYHVRRLVSEGTRPLLPWSGRIGIDQTDTLPLLDTLYGDRTRYVTRSVANHLNDIAKEKPALVVETLKRWKEEGRQDIVEMDWITRHAVRTLIKEGNRDALQLLGYGAKPKLTVSEVSVVDDVVPIGSSLEFTFTITAHQDALLMIDYVIDFVKANNKRAQKVFKIKKLAVQKGDVITIVKKHRFRGDATTIALYPGTHSVILQINGQRHKGSSFELM